MSRRAMSNRTVSLDRVDTSRTAAFRKSGGSVSRRPGSTEGMHAWLESASRIINDDKAYTAQDSLESSAHGGLATASDDREVFEWAGQAPAGGSEIERLLAREQEAEALLRLGASVHAGRRQTGSEPGRGRSGKSGGTRSAQPRDFREASAFAHATQHDPEGAPPPPPPPPLPPSKASPPTPTSKKSFTGRLSGVGSGPALGRRPMYRNSADSTTSQVHDFAPRPYMHAATTGVPEPPPLQPRSGSTQTKRSKAANMAGLAMRDIDSPLSERGLSAVRTLASAQRHYAEKSKLSRRKGGPRSTSVDQVATGASPSVQSRKGLHSQPPQSQRQGRQGRHSPSNPSSKHRRLSKDQPHEPRLDSTAKNRPSNHHGSVNRYRSKSTNDVISGGGGSRAAAAAAASISATATTNTPPSSSPPSKARAPNYGNPSGLLLRPDLDQYESSVDAEGRSSTVYSKAKIFKAAQRPPHGSVVRRQGSGDSGKAYPSSHRQPSAKPHSNGSGGPSSTAAGNANGWNSSHSNTGGKSSSSSCSSGKVPKPSVLRQRSNGGVGSSMESITGGTGGGALDQRSSRDSSASATTPSRRDSKTVLVIEKVRPGESVASWQQRVMLQSWMKEEVVGNWVVNTTLEQLTEHAHHKHQQQLEQQQGAKKSGAKSRSGAGLHDEKDASIGNGSFNQSSERSFEIDAEVGGIPSPHLSGAAPADGSSRQSGNASAMDASSSSGSNSKKSSSSSARSNTVRKSDDSSGGPSSRPTPSRRRNDRNSQDSDNSNSNGHKHHSSSSSKGNIATNATSGSSTPSTTANSTGSSSSSARNSSDSSGSLKLTSANLAAIEARELANLEASNQMFGPPRQLDIAVKGGGELNDNAFGDHNSIASGPPPSPRALVETAATLSRASSFDSLALQRAAFLLEATLSDSPFPPSSPSADPHQSSSSPLPLKKGAGSSSAGNSSSSSGVAAAGSGVLSNSTNNDSVAQARRSNGSNGSHQHRPFPEPARAPRLDVGSSVTLLPATLEDIAARFDAGGLLFNPADVGLVPGDIGLVLGFVKGKPKKSRKRSEEDFGGAYDGSAIEANAPATDLAYHRCLVVVKFNQGTFRLRTTQVAKLEVPEARSEDDDGDEIEAGLGEAGAQKDASGNSSGNNGGNHNRNRRPRSLSSGSNVVRRSPFTSYTVDELEERFRAAAGSTPDFLPLEDAKRLVRALRLESYRPPKKKRALSLDSVLPNDAPPNAAAVANSENSNSTSNSTSNGNSNNTNNNTSSNDNTSSRRRGKSQERADRLSDDAGSAGAVVATREGSRRSGDGNTNQNGGNSGGGNSGENTHATNTARGSRESRESLELPCGPFDEVADPRGPAWVTAWDREGVKALDAAFAKADLENDKSGRVDIYQFTEIYGAVQLGQNDLGTPPLPPPLLISPDVANDVVNSSYSSSNSNLGKNSGGSWNRSDLTIVSPQAASSSANATINGIESFAPLSPPAPSSPTLSSSKGSSDGNNNNSSNRLSPSLPTGGLSLLQSEGAGVELPAEEESAARLAFRTGVRRQERMDTGSGDRADGKLDKRSFKALVRRLHNQAVTRAELTDGTQTPRISLDASFLLAGASGTTSPSPTAPPPDGCEGEGEKGGGLNEESIKNNSQSQQQASQQQQQQASSQQSALPPVPVPSLARLAPPNDRALDDAFNCAGDPTRLEMQRLPSNLRGGGRHSPTTTMHRSNSNGSSGGSTSLDHFEIPMAINEDDFIAALRLLLRASAPALAAANKNNGKNNSKSGGGFSGRRDRSHQLDSGDFDEMDLADAFDQLDELNNGWQRSSMAELDTLEEGTRESRSTIDTFASSQTGGAYLEDEDDEDDDDENDAATATQAASRGRAVRRSNASAGTAASGGRGIAPPKAMPPGALKRHPPGQHPTKNASFSSERTFSVAFAPDTVDHVSSGHHGHHFGNYPSSSSSSSSNAASGDKVPSLELTDPRDGRGLSLDRAERRAKRKARAAAAAAQSENGSTVPTNVNNGHNNNSNNNSSSTSSHSNSSSSSSSRGTRPPPPPSTEVGSPGEVRRRRRRARSSDGVSSSSRSSSGGGDGSGHSNLDEKARRERHERRRRAKEASQRSANGRRRKSKSARAKVLPGMQRQSLARKSSDLSPIGEAESEDEAETDWEDGKPVAKGGRRFRWANLSSEGATTASSGAESADGHDNDDDDEDENLDDNNNKNGEGGDGLGGSADARQDAPARAQRAAEAAGDNTAGRPSRGSGAALSREGFGDDEASDGEEGERVEQAEGGGIGGGDAGDGDSKAKKKKKPASSRRQSRGRTRTVDFEDCDDDDDDGGGGREWFGNDQGADKNQNWDDDSDDDADDDDDDDIEGEGEGESKGKSGGSNNPDFDNNAGDLPYLQGDDYDEDARYMNGHSSSSARTSASARTSSENAYSSRPSLSSRPSNAASEDDDDHDTTLNNSKGAANPDSPRHSMQAAGGKLSLLELETKGLATPRTSTFNSSSDLGLEQRDQQQHQRREIRAPLAPLKQSAALAHGSLEDPRESIDRLSPRRDLNRPLARASSM